MGFSLSIVFLKAINFFFICTRDYNKAQILPSSARKYFFFCYFSKIILISWNQFSFGPKSLFAVGVGRSNLHTYSQGKNPMPWSQSFEILCYSENNGILGVHVLEFPISSCCCICLLVFVLFFLFFLSLFPCYLFVKLFVDLFSYSYFLVCLEII